MKYHELVFVSIVLTDVFKDFHCFAHCLYFLKEKHLIKDWAGLFKLNIG